MITKSVETNVTRVHVNRIYLLLNIVFDSVQVPFVNGNCSLKALHLMQNSCQFQVQNGLFIILANAMHLEERFNGFVSRVHFCRTRHTVSEKGIKIGETTASVV
jgi:hypothetical protein